MKLKSKFLLIFLSTTFIPLVVLGILIQMNTGNAVRTMSEATAMTETHRAAEHLAGYFQGKKTEIATLSRMPLMTEGDTLRIRSFLSEELLLEESEYDKFIVGGDQGHFFNTSGGNPDKGLYQTQDNEDPDAPLRSIAGRDYWKITFGENPSGRDITYISDPMISLSNGSKQVVIASTVRRQGRPVGMLGGAITWDILNQHIEHVTEAISDFFEGQAEMMLIADNGTIVYHWEAEKNIHIREENGTKSIVIPRIGEGDRNPLRGLAAPFRSGETGFEVVDLSGVSSYLFYTPLPGVRYRLGIAVPEAYILRLQKMTVLFLWVSFLLTIFLVGVIAYFIAGTLSRPITAVSDALAEISEGKISGSYNLPVARGDEIGRLSRAVSDMSGSLAAMIANLRRAGMELSKTGDVLDDNTTRSVQSVDGVSGSIRSMSVLVRDQDQSIQRTAVSLTDISRSMSSLVEMIEDQSSHVRESSVAIEQMVTNIQSVNRNTGAVERQFKTLMESSENGRTRLEDMKDKISRIARQSASLQDANNAIHTIASQTNLLSMNAAIEAAHAGEAGKGFAVVSGEIRKLAENAARESGQSQVQLTSIQDLITAIVSSSQVLDEAFRETLDIIGNVSNLVREVGHSMSEQATGSHQVLEALKDMTAITENVRERSMKMEEQGRDAAEEMDTLARLSEDIRGRMDLISDGSHQISTASQAIRELSEKNKQDIRRVSDESRRFRIDNAV